MSSSESIINDASIITASKLVIKAKDRADRVVIRNIQFGSLTFSAHREFLSWSIVKGAWMHDAYSQGYFSRSYEEAFDNYLQLRKLLPA